MVKLGVLRGAYGLKGWARVQAYSTEAAALRANRKWWLFGPDGPTVVSVSAMRRHGGQLVAKWAGCDSPESAEQLRGIEIGVSRADFPPPGDGEVYWVDLVGAEVVNRSGAMLGTVSGVRSSGAQDLLEVQGKEGQFLVPIVQRYVDEVDLAQRQVRVDWELDW